MFISKTHKIKSGNQKSWEIKQNTCFKYFKEIPYKLKRDQALTSPGRRIASGKTRVVISTFFILSDIRHLTAIIGLDFSIGANEVDTSRIIQFPEFDNLY